MNIDKTTAKCSIIGNGINKMNLHIEKARPEHFEQIAQMVLDFFREEKQKDRRTVVSNWDKIMPTILNRLNSKQENFRYYSIAMDGTVIGVVNLLFPVSDKDKDLGEILMWYIEPAYRRQDRKLEKEILDWAAKTLKGLSAKKVRTDVLLTDQKALDCVLESGFKPFTGIFTMDL